MKIPRIKISSSSKREQQVLLKAFRSGKHAAGPYQKIFEKILAKKFGLKYSHGCSNGFFALLLSIHGLGFKNKYIGIPAIETCKAVSAAVIASQNIPIYLDVDHLGRITYESCKIKKKLSAVILVSFFGIFTNAKKLEDSIGIPVIEDCSQSFLTALSKSSFSTAITLSFYPSKGFGLIDGGMLLSNNKKLIDEAKKKSSYDFDTTKNPSDFGYNTRLNNLSAAIGIEKIKNINEIKRRKKLIISKFNSAVKEKKINILKNKNNNEFITRCILKFPTSKIRNKFLIESKKKGIETSIEWSINKSIKVNKNNFKQSKKLSMCTASIPSYESLSQKEINYISKFIKNFND